MFPRKNRVARLVEQLRTPDEAVQHEAIEALESLSNSRITAQEARTALEAARERFPHPEAQELLLQIAYESPDPDFIPIIERDFLHYSPDARSWALRTLAAIGTEDAVRLLAMLLTRHAEDIEELSLLELEK
jgi:HEAT repeat protein